MVAEQNIMLRGNNMRKRYKYINILLSRHFDRVSQMLYHLTGRGYTHASIGLHEDKNTYYSFNGKGFRIEKPARWKKKDSRVQKTIYKIKVEEQEYKKLKEYIKSVKDNQERYKYSPFGVVMCVLRIPFKIKNRYFCSQFVAEALKESGILNTKKPASLFLPNSFRDSLDSLNVKHVCNT